jgi:hypothetical protein
MEEEKDMVLKLIQSTCFSRSLFVYDLKEYNGSYSNEGYCE